jgi:hypothetical protein
VIVPQSGSIDKWLQYYGQNLIVGAHANIMSSGVVIADYPVESFTVTLDSTAASWRTVEVTVAASGLVNGLDPSWMDVFAADGNEIRLWWTQTFPDGSTDEVCTGTFTIVESIFLDTGSDVVVEISGYDRAWLLKDSKLVLPYVVPSGVTIDQAIATMITDNWAGAPLMTNIVPVQDLVPATAAIVKPGKDIWSQALALAASIGYILYFDVWGTLQGLPVPQPSGNSPLINLDAISTSSVLQAKAVSSRKGVVSQVGVIGHGPAEHVLSSGKISYAPTTIYGAAEDTNPLSPTYVNRFGKVGMTIRSTAITTVDQANSAAQAHLDAQLGGFTASELTIFPFPLLDAYDTVSVNAPRVGINGNFIVSGWQGTFHHSGNMTLTLRRAT